jgi:hypothetical protein
MTTLSSTRLTAPPSLATVLSKPAAPPTHKSKPQKLKRLRRKSRKKTTTGGEQPKAKRPDTKWARKPRCMGHSNTYLKRELLDKRDRKKLRGARKKRLLQELIEEEKRLHPKGRAMYKKAPPPHRAVVYTSDVQNLMGCDVRPAQRYMNRLRKKLGKPKRELITLEEFVSNTPFTREEVIKYLV